MDRESAARIAAAQVRKLAAQLSQAQNSDRLVAEAMGWRQGLAEDFGKVAYYYLPGRPTKIVFSVEDIRQITTDKAREEHLKATAGAGKVGIGWCGKTKKRN